MKKRPQEDLSKKLLATQDQEEVDRIIGLFNLDLKKKEAIRATTYSNLQDIVTQEITDRLTRRSGEFSNKDLLDYLNTFEHIVTKNKVDKIDVPQIAVQQNININNVNTLDREARIRIQDAIAQLLSEGAMQEMIVDESDQ